MDEFVVRQRGKRNNAAGCWPSSHQSDPETPAWCPGGRRRSPAGCRSWWWGPERRSPSAAARSAAGVCRHAPSCTLSRQTPRRGSPWRMWSARCLCAERDTKKNIYIYIIILKKFPSDVFKQNDTRLRPVNELYIIHWGDRSRETVLSWWHC